MHRAERKGSDLLFHCVQPESSLFFHRGKETETLASSDVAQLFDKSSSAKRLC